MSNFKKTLSLFKTFFNIGLFTFGGGYAMIPLIQKEVVDNKKWITDEDILNIITIAESTPGPIAINAATFIGFKVCGILGSFFSTLGVVVPSFIIISILSFFITQFQNLQVVKFAFEGIRVGILVLILKALISMYKQAPKGIISYILMALSFVLVAIFNVNVLFVLILCAIVGLISSMVNKGRALK